MANGSVTATDNCSTGLSISQSPTAGTELPEGTHTISFGSTDDEGNTSNCSFELTVVPELGIEDTPFSKGIILYPNPSSDKINIVSKNQNITSISVVDITGKVLINLKNIDSLQTTIDISSFSKGIYFINLNEKASKKIIKQ